QQISRRRLFVTGSRNYFVDGTCSAAGRLTSNTLTQMSGLLNIAAGPGTPRAALRLGSSRKLLSARDLRECLPEFGERDRRRFSPFDHRFPLGCQGGHRKCHGDAMIAEGIEVRGPEFLSAGHD